MESNIISFINNNENEPFIDSFINSLLILSINGFNIQYDQLKKLINYNKNYFTSESNIYGLNNTQFKNLIKDFSRLEDHYLNNNCNNSNINNINNNSNSNSSNCNSNNQIVYSLNNFKFSNIKINYSLYILIDNNKKNINNKLIVDYSTYGSNQTTILFFKIWRNSVLKSVILNNIRLYNIHYKKKFKFASMYDLSNYKLKNYLTSLEITDIKVNNSIQNQINFSNNNNNNNSNNSNINFEQDEYDIFENDDGYFNNYNSGEINRVFKYNLPSSLLELSINVSLQSSDHYRIERMLPGLLVHLEFHGFNRDIPIGALPPSLKSISFGDFYNKPILPGLLSSLNQLTDIKFGYGFQQNINHSTIPNSVTSIYFASNYSGTIYQVLENCVTLEYQVFNSNDLQRIPKYCQTLTFINFNEQIHSNVIPPSVTKIDFNRSRFNLPLGLNSLPPYLRSLSFNKNYSQRIPFLTNSLTDLTIGDYPPMGWPPAIKSLKFGQFYNSTMQPLPRSLTHLDISEFSLKKNSIVPIAIIPESLPSSLISLKLCDYYNVTFSRNSLPSSLTSLILGSQYTQVIPSGSLPNTLINLDLGASFNNSFNPPFLPDSLECLSLGSAFNQDLAFENSLPKSLKLLILNHSSSPILKYSFLPKSLIQIQVTKSNLQFINSLDINISKYLLNIVNK